MSYQELTELPAYEFAAWVNGLIQNPPGVIKWSRSDGLEPPPIGTDIQVTVNGCGPAIITGYFVLEGWLGLRCRLLAPPEWHVKQNNGTTDGHVFGPEFQLA